MDKTTVLQQIVHALQEDYDALQKSVQLATEGATHAESKPENKYDTRALEASYLAHGQAQRAQQIAEALAEFQRLLEQPLSSEPTVGRNSLLCLQALSGEERWLWVANAAGGLKVSHDKQSITVITPDSPLGAMLLGRMLDDEITLKLPGQPDQEYEITTLL